MGNRPYPTFPCADITSDISLLVRYIARLDVWNDRTSFGFALRPAGPLALGRIRRLGPAARARTDWHGRAARLFEQGDLKYVILRLLEEKPRHGYEIIKDLESRFGGSYAPSPGTVYPTLTMLEDLGYARVVPEEGGKKIYEITDEGRKLSRGAQHDGRRHLRAGSRGSSRVHRRADDGAEPVIPTSCSRHLQDSNMTHHGTKRRSRTIREIIQRAADEVEAVVPK